MRIPILILLIFLSACAEKAEEPETVGPSMSTADPGWDPGREAHTSARIYVPVYSHIYYRTERRVINLTVTLSVRNTDSDHPITLDRVDYFDSDGGLVRSYLQKPGTLGPLASRDFVIDEDDTSGGSGANFLVDWSSDSAVTEPVVEAVMISTAATQGISFTSIGRVLTRETAPARMPKVND